MSTTESKTLPLPMRIARSGVASMARPHRWMYQRFGGRLINRNDDSTVLMLTTTGRKSGESRSVLLIHADDGDDVIVVGSNWGMDRPPAWLLNLQANPEAMVTMASDEWPVTASFPNGDEHERCWNLFAAVVPNIESVADNANRKIPVVKLVRTP